MWGRVTNVSWPRTPLGSARGPGRKVEVLAQADKFYARGQEAWNPQERYHGDGTKIGRPIIRMSPTKQLTSFSLATLVPVVIAIAFSVSPFLTV